MTSGTTSRGTRTEITASLIRHGNVESAWGFGSFFRGEESADVDVLVVMASARNTLLADTRAIRADLLAIEQSVGISIDPLILTRTEFDSRPLRDMDQLVRLL